MEATWNAAWQQIEETVRHLLAKPLNNNLQNAVKIAGKTFREVSRFAVLSFFWNSIRKLETRPREGG